MLLCIMETDLALLLTCVPALEQCRGGGGAGTSTCTENSPRCAVQTRMTSLCIYPCTFCSAFIYIYIFLFLVNVRSVLPLASTKHLFFFFYETEATKFQRLCSRFVADPYLTLRELYAYASQRWPPLRY